MNKIETLVFAFGVLPTYDAIMQMVKEERYEAAAEYMEQLKAHCKRYDIDMPDGSINDLQDYQDSFKRFNVSGRIAMANLGWYELECYLTLISDED